ncbi:MAG: trypsin-like peptidase domain-containing protein [Pyrinomonadaceae bacterium]|nr:trypsin-like peptidase domain-containing protein [Pyrinomonadaceae bacterium]
MRKKAMYTLSARQILTIALLSALFAAGAVVFLNQWGNHFQPLTAAFSETPPEGITDPSVASDERNNIEVYKTISPGVISITATSASLNYFDPSPREGTGSGSVIDDQGHILTNDHVVAGAQRLSVNLGGEQTYPAKLIGTDPDTDLAVIKVEAPRDRLTVVPFGDSDKLIVGQKVLAIGNPFGFDRTLTTGVISGLQRPIRAQNNRQIEGAVQTDASINRGNSGGPLLDSQGRMIGINSQILSPSGGSIGIGFAVPVNIAKRIVPQLVRNGAVTRPKLGISVLPVKNIDARLPVPDGVIVHQVYPGSSAAAAGLRSMQQTADGEIILGDIVTAIDGEKISDNDDLFRVLDKHQFGDVVQVEIFRDGRRVSVPVRLLAERRGILRR